MLFHKPSGKTHFVNAATAHLLREVLREPRELAAVVPLFSQDPTGNDHEEALEAALDLLWRLEDLGLVEPA